MGLRINRITGLLEKDYGDPIPVYDEPFPEPEIPLPVAELEPYVPVYDDIVRHGGDIAPDMLQETFFPPPPLGREYNPDFTTIRGGPTMAPGVSGIRGPLVDRVEAEGTPTVLTDELRTRPLEFRGHPDVDPWAQGSFDPNDGKISLKQALNYWIPPVRVARHEAAHAYDWRQGPESGPGQGLAQSDTPGFKAAIRGSIIQYPEQSQYFLERVKKDDPSYAHHVFTAAFDAGKKMSEIPPPLRRFYQGLLPDDTASLRPVS